YLVSSVLLPRRQRERDRPPDLLERAWIVTPRPHSGKEPQSWSPTNEVSGLASRRQFAMSSSPPGGGSMDLSAAAQEALGFADDQFMELSTSGASIYNVTSLLNDPLMASSSGRSAQQTAGAGVGCAAGVDLSNSSLRRLFLSTPGARSSRDEFSLSISGMSLASLGSLSRSKSARRLGGLVDVDEALDDSRAWRNAVQGRLGADLSESGGGRTAAAAAAAAAGAELAGKTAPTGLAHPHDGGVATAAPACAAREADAKVHASGGPQDERAASTPVGADGSHAAAAAEAEAAAGAGDDLPSPPAFLDGRHGRAQDLSQRVAELRQQSYNRRLMATPAAPSRSRTAPPPLPVGVNLASPERPHASAGSKLPPHLDSQCSGQGGKTLAALSAEAYCSDSILEGSSGGLDSSSDSNRRRSRKGAGGRTRKAAASFMRKFGLGQNGRHQQPEHSRCGSLESSCSKGSSSSHVPAPGTAGEGAESGGGGGGEPGSVTSSCWSADSSVQGGGGNASLLRRSISRPHTQEHSRSPVSAPADGAAEPPARSISVGLGTLAEPSAVVSAESAAAPPAAAKRSGLREKLGQVWSSRRKADRRNAAEARPREGDDLEQQNQHHRQLQQQHQHQHRQGGAQSALGGNHVGSSNSGGGGGGGSVPAAVLQPASDGGGGFAFLPAVAPLAGPVAPSGTPTGNGVVSDEGGGGGSAALPTTPLGRSNRSFDPNQPLSGSVDGSNVSLPPQFGTRSAANSLGLSNASFDPNRSMRSWFDMSTESQARVPPGVPPDMWAEPAP
ncbi:unnamed protein product, partial [Scytosiphon promiscuus]